MAIQPYVCEISHVNLRSIVASFLLLFYTAGFALFILKGAFLPWRIAVSVPVAYCLVCLLGFLVSLYKILDMSTKYIFMFFNNYIFSSCMKARCLSLIHI